MQICWINLLALRISLSFSVYKNISSINRNYFFIYNVDDFLFIFTA